VGCSAVAAPLVSPMLHPIDAPTGLGFRRVPSCNQLSPPVAGGLDYGTQLCASRTPLLSPAAEATVSQAPITRLSLPGAYCAQAATSPSSTPAISPPPMDPQSRPLAKPAQLGSSLGVASVDAKTHGGESFVPDACITVLSDGSGGGSLPRIANLRTGCSDGLLLLSTTACVVARDTTLQSLPPAKRLKA